MSRDVKLKVVPPVKKKRAPRYTLDQLMNCYSAGVLRGIAEANGTEDKVMSPEKYFMVNFGIDLSKIRKNDNS